jgi:hypothetical protein
MIWIDQKTGRSWNVHQIGRIGSPTSEEGNRSADSSVREGAIVLAFDALDPPRESRVVTGAPAGWENRPDVLAELFERTNRGR